MNATTPGHLPALRPRVAAAVVAHNGRVLLIRRKERQGFLSWQFPAGIIETGESPQGTAVRETREETGIQVATVLPLGERVHPQTHLPIAYIACHYRAGTAHIAAPTEVAAVEWPLITDIDRYIPHGIFGPAHAYLTSTTP